jgi:hypothetical protein
MTPSRSFSSLLALPALALLSLSTSALPHPRTASTTAALKLAVRINSYGIKNIAAADRARFQTLQSSGSSSVNANNTGTIYTADIGVGSPATYCKLHAPAIYLSDRLSISYRHTPRRHWKLTYLAWGQQALQADYHEPGHTQSICEHVST